MNFWLNSFSICWSILRRTLRLSSGRSPCGILLRNASATASSISIFSLLTSVALAEPPSVETNDTLSQVTSVSQLADVQPTDWAFQALRSLVERYGCISGYPNSTYQGNRSLSRSEFAAGLNVCLDRITERLTAGTDTVSQDDLATLQRLQSDFAAELATQQGRVDGLEARTAELAANQFSTTTRLNGEVLLAVNGGGFEGDRIIDPTGRELANSNPNPTLVYRAALILNTSFTGTDQLRILIDAGSPGGGDNATGVLEPNFGSVLDFSVKPPTNENFELGRLFYTFTPVQDLTVSIAPSMRTTDYIDRNRYANLSNRDFSTLALVNNYILFPIFGPSSGAEVEWNPGKGAFTLRALYAAADAANTGREGPIAGLAFFSNVLYPPPPGAPPTPPGALPSAPIGDRGLFGDTYQSSVEAEYSPSANLAIRFQYSGGEIYGNGFDVFGVNVELALSPGFGLFGRYGYGSYRNTAFGDVNPNYWMAGVAFPDLFVEGAKSGIAIAQPFIVSEIGNATQTNLEVFYNLPLTDHIQVTPLIQVVLDPANQAVNGTIITGTLRTVFSF